ncbi:hypothetical protein TELCIR_05876 [Teladorsagia circumcincta]|uniref:Uncharacterized protein n=1 Tax=Teladorsagia circumcincta TaxID=45464 RepID=A0A2G9UPV8_TELCI|nr:hypothetical protein TELCIR_05876 [Teladorsagia circumcincta]
MDRWMDASRSCKDQDERDPSLSALLLRFNLGSRLRPDRNCGTGYCENRGGRKTCVCSRCANGGNVPLDKLIKGKGRR